MSYTNGLDNPELYFQCKIYTGDGNTGRSITLDGSEDMQPDLVWIKNRDTARKNNVYDSVRGVTKRIVSDSTVAEDTAGNGLTAFNSDGFTTGSETDTNNDTDGIVAWCWKESATAGFDIVSYTGDGNAGATVSHSLSATPSFYVVKTRDSAYDWRAYHKGIGETKYLNLNQNVAVATATNAWNDTAPTSSVFSLGDGSTVNQDTDDFIAYCFAEKQGFSKFSSYTGNGNADGTFVYTGFRPAFVLFKGLASNREWILADNKRDDPHNVIDAVIYGNTNDPEGTNTMVDFLSNGFKFRTSAGPGTINTGGESYIYAAFAEAPFVNSNGVPCNAR